MKYSVVVENDMGHVVIKNTAGGGLPQHILGYVAAQSRRCLATATDHDGLGARFFYLPDSLQERWTYTFAADTIEVHWNTGRFDAAIMRRV
jgi:hypothetical protein